MATPLASTLSLRPWNPLPATQTCTVARTGGLVSCYTGGRKSVAVVVAAGGPSSSGSVAEEEKATSTGPEASAGSDNRDAVSASNVSTSQSRSSFSPTACQACGKEERVGGCNGEGRILGGLSSFPGFGWFPIKAYRPCPAFVDAGGRYKRQGQSLEEVAFGRTGKQDDLDITERLQGGNSTKK